MVVVAGGWRGGGEEKNIANLSSAELAKNMMKGKPWLCLFLYVNITSCKFVKFAINSIDLHQ